MKLNISKEWLLAAIEREVDCEVGACSPEIVQRARDLATQHGHKDVDELIVCKGGSKMPVWQFYIDEAAFSAGTCGAPTEKERGTQ